MIEETIIDIIAGTSPLYKRDSKGKVRVWRAEVGVSGASCFWRTIAGLDDGKHVESGWKVVEQKNVGKANETSLEDQAVAEMMADFNKKAERGYFRLIGDIDKFDKIKPMLASKHEDAKYDFEKNTYYSQPKLDGIRCVARKDGLWSRSGKLLLSVPHISEELKALFVTNPDVILDGELYNHDLRENFNKITSLVRKTKPTPEDIEESKLLVDYHVYDVISHPGTFSERSDWFASQGFNGSVQTVETTKVATPEVLDDIYGLYLEDGYEGQMVRTDSTYQQNKRSKGLIKRKEFLTDEYDVLRVEEGKGNWAGTIKRFVMQTENGQESGAGVRGSQELMGAMFESKEVPTWCTLRYFAPTPDGIPRFPVVIDWGMGQRND